MNQILWELFDQLKPHSILILSSLAGAFALLTFFLLIKIRRKNRSLRDLLQTKEELIRAEEKLIQVEVLKEQLDRKDTEHRQTLLHTLELEKQVSELGTRIEEQSKAVEEKSKLLEKTQEELKNTFKALSTDALKKNTESFLHLASSHFGQLHEKAQSDLKLRQQKFDSMIQPIQDSLKKVDSSQHEIRKTIAESKVSFSEQIKGLLTSQTQLQQETSQLVKALRRPTVRGQWGEMQLRKVVEIAGMQKHCDFVEQPSKVSEDNRLRPDMIIQLPGGKQIVVDSKTPLESYLNAVEVEGELEKSNFLKNHAKQIRNHINQLSSKSYWGQFQPAPEFVVLFLPGEAFFSAALDQDPHLMEFAIQKGIIVASPTNLIALLRSAAYGWQQEVIAKNAQIISGFGRELYERISVLCQHFDEIRKGINRTVDAYNKTIGSFESRVVVTARKLKEAGATSKAEIPELETVEKSPRTLEIS